MRGGSQTRHRFLGLVAQYDLAPYGATYACVETRDTLGLALSVATAAPRPQGGFGVFRM